MTCQDRAKNKLTRNLDRQTFVDGQVPTASSDKTNLIVAKSFYQINADDKKRFCLNRLKQTPIDISSIVYTKEITIDGMSGFEIYAKGSNNETNETENIYQVNLFNNKLYYMLFGTTNDQTDQSIEEMKKAIMTFRRNIFRILSIKLVPLKKQLQITTVSAKIKNRLHHERNQH